MTTPGYPTAPEAWANPVEHRRKIARTANLALAGKLNAVTSVTLTPSATSTVITDSRIGASTFISLFPRSANAVTAQISGLFIAANAKQNGKVTITHASSTNTDQTFDVLLIG
jgi:hypothetical protein